MKRFKSWFAGLVGAIAIAVGVHLAPTHQDPVVTPPPVIQPVDSTPVAVDSTPAVDTAPTPPPVVRLSLASISPASVHRGTTATLVFRGTGFTRASTVGAVGTDQSVGSSQVNAAGTELTLTIVIPDAQPVGAFNVFVRDGSTQSETRAVTILPADVAAVTPPPPPANGGTATLSGLQFIGDDWSSYASTDALLRAVAQSVGGKGSASSLYSGGANVNLIEIDKSVTYNGHPTVKYTQPGGAHTTPELGVRFAGRAHIWYRVKVRFGPGFTTTGTLANYGNAYKLLEWTWAGHEGSGRLEIANVSQYQLYENVQSGPSVVGGGNYLMGGNISTEWTDGAWYDYVIEVDHSKPVGVIRLWRGRDGSPLSYKGEVNETMKDGSQMPALVGVGIGLNFNQTRAANQTQSLWWGQWEVVDGSQHANPYNLATK